MKTEIDFMGRLMKLKAYANSKNLRTYFKENPEKLSALEREVKELEEGIVDSEISSSFKEKYLGWIREIKDQLRVSNQSFHFQSYLLGVLSCIGVFFFVYGLKKFGEKMEDRRNEKLIESILNEMKKYKLE